MPKDKPVLGHAAFYPTVAPKPHMSRHAPKVLEADLYRVMEMAVEQGVNYALTRSNKHAEDPITEAQATRLRELLNREVLSSICEWFKFPE